MTLLRRCCAFALLAVSLAPAWGASEAGPRLRRPLADAAPDEARVIVKYRSDSTLMRPLAAASAARPQHATALGQRLGLVMKDRWVLGARVQSLSAKNITAAELARRLAAQPDVEWAEPVGRKTIAAALPNDPYYGPGLTGVTPTVGQWYLRAPDSTFVSAINAIGAWSLTTGSAAITVAVLDTGVRFDHPDFKNADGTSKLYAGYDFISHGDAQVDGDGRDADASDPGDGSSASDTSSWHGTQTAGLIGAATDNSTGMASVGRDVMVLPVRVLGKGGGYDDDIQAGMLWAAGVSSSPVVNAHPAKVINMSLGSTGPCSASYQSVFDQLVAKGVSVVVSAGNENGLAVGTPANCVGAIAVGGVRHLGTKVGFSDVGPEITISAPGGNCVNLTGPCLYPILTTTNSGRTTPSTNTYSNSFDYSVGTSFSSPLVAGAVATMLSFDPTLTPAQVKATLKSTARPFPTTGADANVEQCHAPNAGVQDECYCTTTTCGAGMLDVGAAVAAVATAASANVALPAVAIGASSTTPTVGASVDLDSAGTGAFGGRTIATYQWAITDGGTLATLTGSSTGKAALATSGTGNVTVQLTVVDSGGASTSESLTIAVQAVPSSGGGGTDSGGDSGGGAFSAVWLALLALAVFALRRRAGRA